MTTLSQLFEDCMCSPEERAALTAFLGLYRQAALLYSISQPTRAANGLPGEDA